MKEKLETVERFENVDHFWLGAEFMSNGKWKWTHNRQSFDGMFFLGLTANELSLHTSLPDMWLSDHICFDGSSSIISKRCSYDEYALRQLNPCFENFNLEIGVFKTPCF